MKRIGVYTHGGSGNHGCEALVRTLEILLPDMQIKVISQRPYEDRKYINNSKMEFCDAMQDIGIVGKILNRIQGTKKMIMRRYRPTIKESNDREVMISIGGDNYCYEDFRKIPGIIREGFKENTKTILFGCSIDQAALMDEDVINDLSQYDLITAREKLTYNLLNEKLKDTRIEYFPDSAFLLPCDDKVDLPIEAEFVGINISPMVLRKEYSNGMLMERIYELVEYIIDQTSYCILLIPHVIWENNDDRDVLNIIYEKYSSSGRVFLAEDDNCCKLKGLISKCQFFIGARTHATIAAYSNCVPTLVLGYSIKSEGIAKDLFGESDNYLIPVNQVEKDQLVKEFIKLQEKENEIREHLQLIMPEYKKKALGLKETMLSIMDCDINNII